MQKIYKIKERKMQRIYIDNIDDMECLVTILANNNCEVLISKEGNKYVIKFLNKIHDDNEEFSVVHRR